MGQETATLLTSLSIYETTVTRMVAHVNVGWYASKLGYAPQAVRMVFYARPRRHQHAWTVP